MNNWTKEFSTAITVCDTTGIVLEMNDKSAKVFESDGGMELIGKNLYDCHSEPSCVKLKKMMKEEKVNCYTIEKAEQKKLIYQSPWYEEGKFKGFVEIAIEIPENMPHFVRG
ncbi:MAG: diguanylate cyclase [Ignavibacteriae bacterium]|nr:MAG: diguanylate cyclase [Ignavibacteriota bacterium]